ncbi:hypothetical protein EDB81DRAFT_835133 [Dactylonectria macrodidyma]|uniref:Ubiquitin-like protease family profile domain-containing protein n=1 Tax=Dactylonectria macrodidyma TaxID=307937 RepID=A0A9P9CXP4_9HYPO|nr:hypothetical protein EDB81DRAFT_835133 [Dactylonectria macrodidyma]
MSSPVHAIVPQPYNQAATSGQSKLRNGRPRGERYWTTSETAEQRCIAKLKDAWGNHWLPSDVRTSRVLGLNSLKALCALTEAAQKHQVPLKDIWKPGHYMRKELPGERPLFTITACKNVIRSISTRESIMPSVEESGMDYIGTDESRKFGDGEAGDQMISDSERWIDLTQESPDQDARQTKRRRLDDTQLRVHKFLYQLTNEVALSDDVMDFIIRVLTNLTTSESILLQYPLWFQDPNWNQLPTRPRSLNVRSLLCFPIHHKEPLHWTLATVQINNNKAVCTFYDSITNEERAGEVETRLQQCMAEWEMSQRLVFNRSDCAQQDDATSCGVIVLSNMLNILRGESVPKLIEDPSIERQRLLSLLCNADGSLLSPEEDSLLNGMRKHAIMQASQDEIQQLIHAEEQRLMKATHAHRVATETLSDVENKAKVTKVLYENLRPLNDQTSSGYENLTERGASNVSNNENRDNEESGTRLRAVKTRVSSVMDKALETTFENGRQEGMEGCLKKVGELATGFEKQTRMISSDISQYLADIDDATTKLKQLKDVGGIKRRLDELDARIVYELLSSHT